MPIRQRRLRYLGHILRLPPERLLRKALFAYVMGSDAVPAGSLTADCPQDLSLEDLARLATDRKEAVGGYGEQYLMYRSDIFCLHVALYHGYITHKDR